MRPLIRSVSRWVREIYAFLNSAEVTTRRRASTFRVSSAAVRAQLDFSLDKFPRELLAALTETELVRSIVELRLPGFETVADQPLDWEHSTARRAWDAIAPRWDGDFYDDGFHRALSYAHTVVPRGDGENWRRLESLVAPILDRLAAIVDCGNELRPIAPDGTTWWHSRDKVTFAPRLRPARSHGVRREQAAPLLRATVVDPWRGVHQRMVLDELHHILHGAVIAIHLFEHETFEREDTDDWLQVKLGAASLDAYLRWMEEQTADYARRLDAVAPVVGDIRETVVQERLVEFLLLPFWKNRWFLYELWTLVLVLAAAAAGAAELAVWSSPGTRWWRPRKRDGRGNSITTKLNQNQGVTVNRRAAYPDSHRPASGIGVL